MALYSKTATFPLGQIGPGQSSGGKRRIHSDATPSGSLLVTRMDKCLVPATSSSVIAASSSRTRSIERWLSLPTSSLSGSIEVSTKPALVAISSVTKLLLVISEKSANAVPSG